MSIESKPFYWLRCDGCGVREPPGDADAVAWGDEDQALLCAAEAGWETGYEQQRCPDCLREPVG